jgi:hypothetical protein
MRVRSYCLLVTALAVIGPTAALAQAPAGAAGLGVRVGVSGHTRAGNFTGYDLVGSLPLPWRWGSAEAWSFDTNVEGTVGILIGGGQTGFVGSAGPSLTIRRSGIPLYVDGGTAAALISEHRFGRKNFGTFIQFISHISILLQLGPVNTGYRLQHMSNASIDEHNPGVNLHMLEVRYRF